MSSASTDAIWLNKQTNKHIDIKNTNKSIIISNRIVDNKISFITTRHIHCARARLCLTTALVFLTLLLDERLRTQPKPDWSAQTPRRLAKLLAAPRCVKLRSCERPHQRRKRVAARRRRSIANARTARTVRAKLANQTTLSILSYLELKSGALCTAVKPHANDNTTRAIVFTLQTNQNKTNNYREKNNTSMRIIFFLHTIYLIIRI